MPGGGHGRIVQAEVLARCAGARVGAGRRARSCARDQRPGRWLANAPGPDRTWRRPWSRESWLPQMAARAAKPLIWALPDPHGEPTLLASVRLEQGRPATTRIMIRNHRQG